MKYSLLRAREYENELSRKIPEEERPVFHLTPCVGWMNDPNGFSYYKGEYHLFYQYNPYDTAWDSMHWGHAVSRDMLHWRHLPAAMAPDHLYDSFGVFSGSAIETPDGKHLLMYTGVRKENGAAIQTQCIAHGRGQNYRKYSLNPVLDERDLPEGMTRNNFRDPKIWQEADGSYRCVIGACRENRLGSILLYSSADGYRWHFESVLAENDGSFGRMWECPDFFELDGKAVLLVSPQDMLPKGHEYHSGNGTVCMIGELDAERRHFSYTHDQAVDYGIDFYAPTTQLLPDGRRVMIGWMQNWDTVPLPDRVEHLWFGQMSIPRELSIRDGRLVQKPVRELEAFRKNRMEYRGIDVNGEITLPGIRGRCAELFVTIRPADPEKLFQKFTLFFAKNENYWTSISFRPYESTVKIDRKFSGMRRAVIHQRRCLMEGTGGELSMHVIIDRYSVEAFLNDGEKVMTATFFTDPAADGISFSASGDAVMDVVFYDFFLNDIGASASRRTRSGAARGRKTETAAGAEL